jgi:hypothetical protein
MMVGYGLVGMSELMDARVRKPEIKNDEDFCEARYQKPNCRMRDKGPTSREIDDTKSYPPTVWLTGYQSPSACSVISSL